MRVYAYSSKRGPVEGAAKVNEQIERAHRYYNTLVELERARRAAREKIIESDPGVATARRAFETLTETAVPAEGLRTSDARVPAKSREEKEAIRAAADVLWQARRDTEKRLAIAPHVTAIPVLKEIDEGSAVAVRRARRECGVYWGTYLSVEDAVQRARRSGKVPKFRRWDGSGMIAVQIQSTRPMTVEELLAGQDSRARILGEGQRRHLWIRVGSDDARGPVWAVFPIIYHRDLPPGVRVVWIRVTRRHVALHHTFSAQIVLDFDGAPLPAPKAGSIAIDVGWRKLASGMRVAVWRDDAGRGGELRLPERLISRWQKVADLESIRDKNFNEARAKLLEARRAGSMPEWVVEATQHAHAWHAQGRLAALTLRWRAEFEAAGVQMRLANPGAPPSMLLFLEAWRKRDRHLYEWAAHQHRNVLLARRESYRVFARQIAGCKRVIVEKMDLRDFAEVPEAREDGELREDPRTMAARGRRFQVALSELFGCMADAVRRAGGEWIEVDPKDTTRECADCHHVEAFDAAGSVDHTCTGCGRTWDQDVNAARNLLARAVGWRAGDGGRSRLKTPVGPGESASAVRRARGLATRRAGRSQPAV